MKKKKLLIIGPRNSGKTTLANYFEGNRERMAKKANIVYGKETIKTPSTYLESPWMRQHIISLQQSAYLALFLLPLNTKKISYPPGFAQVFRIPVIGVITYTNNDVINQEVKDKVKKKINDAGIFESIVYINIEKSEQIDTIMKFYQERR